MLAAADHCYATEHPNWSNNNNNQANKQSFQAFVFSMSKVVCNKESYGMGVAEKLLDSRLGRDTGEAVCRLRLPPLILFSRNSNHIDNLASYCTYGGGCCRLTKRIQRRWLETGRTNDVQDSLLKDWLAGQDD